MRRNEIFSISLIVIVFAFSFFAITSSQANTVCFPCAASRIEDTKPLILSIPLMFGLGFHEDSRLLNQSTRMEIYNFIRNNPGTHFRDICDNLGLSIGVVQYHLGLLIRSGLVSVHHDRRYRRYFESERFGKIEMETISLLRHETAGKILAALSERGSIFHKDLALKLHVSSQGLTWQMNLLKKIGLIGTVKEGMKLRYLLNEEYVETVKRCLGFMERPNT